MKYLLVFCIGYLHSKFAGTSHDSLLFLFVLPMRDQVLGRGGGKPFRSKSYNGKSEIMNFVKKGTLGASSYL